MYVHQTYRGPRNGRRLVEYFDDVLAARLDTGDEGAVLRIRTADGHVDLSMGLDELQHLVRAFADPVDAESLGFDLEVKLPEPEPTLTPLPTPIEVQEPQSAWDRLLRCDLLEPAAVQP